MLPRNRLRMPDSLPHPRPTADRILLHPHEELGILERLDLCQGSAHGYSRPYATIGRTWSRTQQMFTKERSMTDPSNSPNDKEERIPAMQSLLENPFLLLFIGVAMPTVFYIVWGIMEIASLPIAQ